MERLMTALCEMTVSQRWSVLQEDLHLPYKVLSVVEHLQAGFPDAIQPGKVVHG